MATNTSIMRMLTAIAVALLSTALPTTVFFCDYASAGNTWHRDNHYRTWFPVEYGPQE